MHLYFLQKKNLQVFNNIKKFIHFCFNNIDAWNTSIRSKTSIISSKKKVFTDPSFAVASMNLSPNDLEKD